MIEQLAEFIGRSNELKLIEKLVKEWNTLRILCIHGPGGIGKTRLLLEVCKIYPSTDTLCVVPIFDFFDTSLHIRQNIGFELANRLGKDEFEKYLIALDDLRKMELAGVRHEKIIEEYKILDSVFISCYNENLASYKRVILPLDTLEFFQDNNLWNEFLLKLLKSLNNTLILVAGRRINEIVEGLNKFFGKNAVSFIILPPFTSTETESFFEKSRIGAEIDSTTREKIYYLTDGKPILIDLAIDLLGRELPLPEITEKSLKELQAINKNDFKNLKENFERALVKNILNFTEPIHKAILLMAVIRRSFNAEMLSFLNNMSINDSVEIIKELQALSFVKPRTGESIILHDEMRRMVNEYIWPDYDVFKTQITEVQEKLSNYYQRVIQELENQIKKAESEINDLKRFPEKERLEKEVTLRNFISTNQIEIWFLRIEWLYHSLRANLKKGLKVFIETADLATERFRYDFRDALFKEAYEFLNQYEKEDKYEIYIREARYLLDEGKYKEGYEKVNELFKEYADGGEREVDMLIQIGNNVYRIGKTQEAIQHFDKALQICETNKLEKWKGRLFNEIGWLYRRMGYWQKAAEYYHKSLDHAQKLKDFIRIADTLNNLGFVFGLWGDYGSAIAYCNQALEIRQGLNIPKDIGMSYNTLAMVYRSKREFETSLKYSDMAASIFEEHNDLAWLARVYRERGVSHWFLGELEKAKEELEKSITISERYGFHTELSNTYHRLGHVMWELGLKEINRNAEKAKEFFKETEKLFIDSYKKGEEVADIYMTINSLAGIIELFYDLKHTVNIDRLDEIPSYYEILQNYESHPEYHYPLYYGSVERILGAIAQEEGNYNEALKHYKKAYPQIAEMEGYSRYILDNKALGFLEQKIKDLPPEIAIQWCEELIEVWNEKKLETKYPEFISTCKMLKLNSTFKIRKEKAE